MRKLRLLLGISIISIITLGLSSNSSALSLSDQLTIKDSLNNIIFDKALFDGGQEQDIDGNAANRIQFSPALFQLGIVFANLNAVTIALTEPVTRTVSDLIKMTVVEVSSGGPRSVTAITLISDSEGGGLIGEPFDISIPEGGDTTHPPDALGFLNITSDLFPANVLNGQNAPIGVFVRSDADPDVPEPSTWLLLGSGLVALAVLKQKRESGHRS